jgi:hypothetical protein
MESQRLRSITIFSLLLALVLFTILSELIYYRTPTQQDLYGLGGGIILGSLICAYLNRRWDPIDIKPLRPDPMHTPWWIRYALPIATFLAATISPIAILLFGEQRTTMLAMGAGGTMVTCFIYFIARLWWHRPRGR